MNPVSEAKAKLLILTSSTGSGHDKRAEALFQWIQLEFTEKAEVHIEKIIENSSLIGRFGVWIYNTIQRYAPRLHNIYFFIVELFTKFHTGGVSFGGRYYRKLISTYRPTHILSVHDSTNRGYFEDAKKILGANNVKCMTYCGEFTGGYGFSRNWVNPNCDHFFARTQACAEFAIGLGMNAQKISIFRKVLPPIAFRKILNDEEKKELRKKLNLDSDRLTVFLATGGYGANHHLKYLTAIRELGHSVQAIVVCGRNEKVLKAVQQWKIENLDFRIHLEGFSTRMHLLMQISDLIVTRGGANSTTEAIHFETPVLYDTIGGIMPQEHCTVRYFLEKNVTHLLKTPKDLKNILSNFVTHPKLLIEKKSLLRKLNPNENPRTFIKELLA